MVCSSKAQEIKKEVRNLKYFEADHFIYDLSNIPWGNIENIDNPNLAWKIWKTNFNTIFDKHAPIRHKGVKNLLFLGLILISNS